MGQASQHQVTLYNVRWCMLAIFLLNTFTTSHVWGGYIAITDIVEDYYNVGVTAANWLSEVFYAAYVPCQFVSQFVLEKNGLRASLLVGAALNTLGAIIKATALGRASFAVLMTGQTVCAFAQPFIVQVTAQVSAQWFGQDECSIATAIGIFANQAGAAAGVFLSPLVVQRTTLDEVQQGLLHLHIVQILLSFFGLLLLFIFFKDSPPTPPSIAQQAQISYKMTSSGNCQDLSDLLRNPSFVVFLIGFSCYISISFTFSTLVNNILQDQYPDQNVFVGNVGSLFLIIGLPATIFAGIWIERSRHYKCTLVTLSAMTTISYAIFAAVLPRVKSKGLIYFLISVFGVVGTALISIGLEFAAEITYPVPAGFSSGLVITASQVLCVGTVSLGSALLENGHAAIDILNWGLTGLSAIATVLLCLVKTDLKRSTVEKYSIVPS